MTVPRHAMTFKRNAITGHKILRSTADCLLRLAVQHNKERRVVNRDGFCLFCCTFHVNPGVWIKKKCISN